MHCLLYQSCLHHLQVSPAASRCHRIRFRFSLQPLLVFSPSLPTQYGYSESPRSMCVMCIPYRCRRRCALRPFSYQRNDEPRRLHRRTPFPRRRRQQLNEHFPYPPPQQFLKTSSPRLRKFQPPFQTSQPSRPRMSSLCLFLLLLKLSLQSKRLQSSQRRSLQTDPTLTIPPLPPPQTYTSSSLPFPLPPSSQPAPILSPRPVSRPVNTARGPRSGPRCRSCTASKESHRLSTSPPASYGPPVSDP